MSEISDPRLEQPAGRVADAESPDWDSAVAQQPDLARPLTALRTLERIAAVYRRARDADAHAPAVSGPADDQAAAAAATPAKFNWGLLRAIDRIGQGSFGEVWRAYDPSLHREVALKLRRLDPTPDDPALAMTRDYSTKRSVDEARRLASVRHPNVLTVFGAAEHDGRVGMWTELVRGETLEEYARRTGNLSAGEAASIGLDLCGAVSAVHLAGLVHGDIKASNVMIEPVPGGPGSARPRVVLMDFGAAHDRRIDPALLVEAPAGTPLVMAPEVLAGAPPSPRSDVFSVGALLHWLVTGRYPYEAASLDVLRLQHARDELPPLARERRGVPSSFVRIVVRALAIDPAKRYRSAEELRRALASFQARGRRWVIAGIGAVAASAAAFALATAILAHRPSPDRYVALRDLPGRPVEDAMVVSDTLIGERESGMGWSFAGVGDVNGDGLADALIVNSNYGGEFQFQGRVRLFLGNRRGRFGAAAQQWVGGGPGWGLGASLALVGDLDHDGHQDLAMSDTWSDSATHLVYGSVMCFRGDGRGFEPRPAVRVIGDQPGARFGLSMAAVGDVDGDGNPDLLVSAPHYSHRFTGEGAAFLFRGDGHAIATKPSWVVYGGAAQAQLGLRLTRVGDVNGDGFDDLLVPIQHWSGRHLAEGRVELYYGGPHGPAARPNWTLEGDVEDGRLGFVTTGLGDINGDGCADFAVGEPGWSGRGVAEGRVRIFLGSRTGPPRAIAWQDCGYGAGAQLGTFVSQLGDVNGDGRPDFQTSAPFYSESDANGVVGVCNVHLGDGDNFRAGRVWRIEGHNPGLPFAPFVAPLGDYNGDGLADMLVSDPWYPDRFATDSGRIFLLLGRRSRAAR